jgi:hypothetical protein
VIGMEKSPKIPNLYLKWRAFRSLIHDERSDAEIAGSIVFEGKSQPEILFSRLLYGERNCDPVTAGRLVDDVINRCIAVYRHTHGLPVAEAGLSAGDLRLPSYEFTRKLIAAAGKVSPSQLDAVEDSFVTEFAPPTAKEKTPTLAILRFDVDRSFPPLERSGGDPIKFKPGQHQGQFIVKDLAEDPVAVYALWTRNPYPLSGKRIWELDWGDTVLWLPSPMKITRTGNTLNLLPPSPVQPAFGCFTTTVVLVFDPTALAKLDPRGANASAGALDELQTARFITNMKRLESPKKESNPKKKDRWSKNPPIRVVANKYIVQPLQPAAVSSS